MLIDSTFSKSFSSFNMNEVKLFQLKNKAEKIRDFKNEISEIIHSDFYSYVEKSKFDVVKEFNTKISNVSGQEIQIAIGEVYDSYSNKFKQIKKKMTFKIQKEIEIIEYKKNTKKNKKGDTKFFEVKFKSTKLTKIMSFLARYGYVGILKSTKKRKFKPEEKDKELFYKDLFFYLEKFTEEKLLELALNRRDNLIERYNKKPIEFRSLNYRSISRIKTNIVDYNKNYNSSINSFINLGGFEKGILQIPTKHSKDYHGKIDLYKTKKGKQNTTSYTIVFKDRDKINIIIPIDGVREIPDALENTNYLGVDINVKHNLFYLDDEKEIDFDREMIQDYVKFLKYLDNKRKTKRKMGLKKEEVSKLSNKDFKSYKKIRTKIKNMIILRCVVLIHYAIAQGKNHLILEDLKLFGKLCSKSDEFEGFKYSRLIRFLNLSDIKNIITSIAHKKGISVSFVNPDYTSQMCNSCKGISKSNRKTQEKFKCVSCGKEFYADYNSSLNIKDRVLEDVLRDQLLMTNEFNEFIPKKLKRNKIKKIILSYSSNFILADHKVS